MKKQTILKVKARSLTKKDLEELGEKNLQKARQFFMLCPFATKVYLSAKTGISLKFVVDNWDKIISEQ